MQCAFETTEPAYIKYHDEEWGHPNFDDRYLFELLSLEGAQTGLNWWTILKRREAYRQAFDSFDYHKIANYDDKKLAELMADEGIIRNRRKIESVINNARLLVVMEEKGQSFSDYIWSFVDGQPIDNRPLTPEDIPSQTALSQAMSRQMKEDGFKFVGPVNIYAFMQAVGMVNDHLVSCPIRQLL